MRCLLCHKQLGSDDLADLLLRDDVLCSACREDWHRSAETFVFHGVKAYALWQYEDGFSHCLLQYKERYDEALAPVFLYPERKKIRRKFRGYTLCLLPSTAKKQQERGFDHLTAMCACLHMEILCPFALKEEISQKERSAAARARMADNIRLKEGTVLPDKICLFDDVMTTGATMYGALKAVGRKKDVCLFCAAVRRKYEKAV